MFNALRKFFGRNCLADSTIFHVVNKFDSSGNITNTNVTARQKELTYWCY